MGNNQYQKINEATQTDFPNVWRTERRVITFKSVQLKEIVHYKDFLWAFFSSSNSSRLLIDGKECHKEFRNISGYLNGNRFILPPNQTPYCRSDIPSHEKLTSLKSNYVNFGCIYNNNNNYIIIWIENTSEQY